MLNNIGKKAFSQYLAFVLLILSFVLIYWNEVRLDRYLLARKAKIIDHNTEFPYDNYLFYVL